MGSILVKYALLQKAPVSSKTCNAQLITKRGNYMPEIDECIRLINSSNVEETEQK